MFHGSNISGISNNYGNQGSVNLRKNVTARLWGLVKKETIIKMEELTL